MCDCVYCQGDKPWSGDPDEWPHTPPVYVFLALQDKDPNLWWRMSSGHGQNIAEEAIDLCEELTNENKWIRHDLTSILTDLIAELRATHKQGKRCVMDCCSSCTRCDRNDSWPCAEIKAADRAEARLREATGDE